MNAPDRSEPIVHKLFPDVSVSFVKFSPSRRICRPRLIRIRKSIKMQHIALADYKRTYIYQGYIGVLKVSVPFTDDDTQGAASCTSLRVSSSLTSTYYAVFNFIRKIQCGFIQRCLHGKAQSHDLSVFLVFVGRISTFWFYR